MISCRQWTAVEQFSNHKQQSHHSTPKKSINLVVQRQQRLSTGTAHTEETTDECVASLQPGRVVKIRIGDMTKSRKAWKKRRRSGSPILLPCSILGMRTDWMIRGNVIHILHSYGEYRNDTIGVALSVGKMVKWYERDLGGPLLNQAKALGHDTVGSLLLQLFDEVTKREYGVELVRGLRESLLLVSTFSRRQARDSVRPAVLAQFNSNTITAGDEIMQPHIGTIKVREQDEPTPTLGDTSSDSTVINETKKTKKKDRPRYRVEPLSTAVRVSQRDLDSNRVQSNQERNAFVFSFEPTGDYGSPLVTLTIDSTRGHVRDRMKRRAHVKRNLSMSDKMTMRPLEQNLEQLKVGDGPFVATVVRISTRAGAAFVDLGVGRKAQKGTTRVLGMLRFNDLVQSSEKIPSNDLEEKFSRQTEEPDDDKNSSLFDGDDDDVESWETDDDNGDNGDTVITSHDLFTKDDDDHDWGEVEEDVTHEFDTDEDGLLLAIDAETGKRNRVPSERNDEDNDDEEHDFFSGMTPEERLDAISSMLKENENTEMQSSTKQTTVIHKKANLNDNSDIASDLMFMKVGDRVNVYIQGIFHQSGRFMVTLNPKDCNKLKREEREASKKLSKLAARIGGGLQKVFDGKGSVGTGVVMAKSKTGNWYYVRPDKLEDGSLYPVGIASADEDGTDLPDDGMNAGDKVLIRLEGIDNSRGQLSFTILGKVH